MRTSTVPRSDLTGGILAGGQGSRLGGTDKGWLEIGGQPLIERVLERLQPQVDGAIVINANRRTADYARYGWPVVGDALADFPGPLAGIEALLAAARTEWVLCVPVDAARLPADLAQRLCAAARQNGSRAAFVSTAEGPIPVCCLLSRTLYDDLRTRLSAGERRVQLWLARVGAVAVPYDDWPREYWSVNTPEELQALAVRLAGETC